MVRDFDLSLQVGLLVNSALAVAIAYKFGRIAYELGKIVELKKSQPTKCTG